LSPTEIAAMTDELREAPAPLRVPTGITFMFA